MKNSLSKVLKKIEVLQRSVETPWEIQRVFGKIELHGNNICFRSKDDNDFVTIGELRVALILLVELAGGTVKWKKETDL